MRMPVSHPLQEHSFRPHVVALSLAQSVGYRGRPEETTTQLDALPVPRRPLPSRLGGVDPLQRVAAPRTRPGHRECNHGRGRAAHQAGQAESDAAGLLMPCPKRPRCSTLLATPPATQAELDQLSRRLQTPSATHGELNQLPRRLQQMRRQPPPAARRRTAGVRRRPSARPRRRTPRTSARSRSCRGVRPWRALRAGPNTPPRSAGPGRTR
mmetsp:Transcript_2014/g.5443  ORF Transcript_2014/g.5443 Transcript_2014/m.5443 type:complete len:211 (+) Transcript_2014:209-841(+)